MNVECYIDTYHIGPQKIGRPAKCDLFFIKTHAMLFITIWDKRVICKFLQTAYANRKQRTKSRKKEWNPMSILNKIIECEIEYLKCFCKSNEQPDFIRFQDNLMPDMYYHNYTWVKSINNDNALLKLIESEITYSKSAGKNSCLIRCHIPISNSILTQLARLTHKPKVSVSGYYVFDVSNLPNLNKVKDCSVVKVENDEMVEDILMLDLQHDEEELGRDFCTRRVYRRKDIYLSDEGVDSYICYYNNEAVGNCDLFIHNGAAKIEDFAVSPQSQRKGYGTTILKSLIETALKRNADIVYLETDEGDTAKEMYRKCGLFKINDFTDLLFNF